MRTLLSWLLFALLTALACAGFAAESTNAPPVMVVLQFPDYPGAKGSHFPGGLIAALWSDGRLIRPTGSNTIGKAYVEGVVSAADREKFFAFLKESAALRNQPDRESIPLHEAYQTVTLYKDSKITRWRRPLPDRKAGFSELQERLWALPLTGQRPADLTAVRLSTK